MIFALSPTSCFYTAGYSEKFKLKCLLTFTVGQDMKLNSCLMIIAFVKLYINFLSIIVAFLLMDNSNEILIHISIYI